MRLRFRMVLGLERAIGSFSFRFLLSYKQGRANSTRPGANELNERVALNRDCEQGYPKRETSSGFVPGNADDKLDAMQE